MSWSAQQIKAAQTHLRKSDAVMKGVIKAVGPFTLRVDRQRFAVLVKSIVSQQISTAAATTILGRLQQAIGETAISAQAILDLDQETLKGCGLSSRKCQYLIDLANRVESGALTLDQLGRCNDETVIEQLTQVKGIGRWTAQMFLIFSLGRLDVIASDDLGLRSAIMRLYDLSELPDRPTFENVASVWRPYASVASWYCWRALDLGLTPAELPTG